MTIRQALLIFLAILTLAGCDTRRSAAEAGLRDAGPERLRADCARMYKDLFASRAPEYTALKQSLWPKSIVQFKPLHVGAFADGIAVALEDSGEAEAGIYIVPLGMDHIPTPTDHAKFIPMSEGIFWYSFTR